MKNRTITPLHKKRSVRAVMVLALLSPTLLTTSHVFAEDSPAETEQTTPAVSQESAETTEATLESATTVESSSTEAIPATTIPMENETTMSTTESTTENEAIPTSIAPSADTIEVADPVLKQAIVSSVGLPAGSELTQADMDRLTNLNLSSTLITSLSGLEHATNLSSIYINVNNSITDFSPLEQLSSLTYVTLQTKSLTSANFPDLSKSTGLTNLSIAATSIDNDVLPKIAQLTSLTRIYMDTNMNITSIAPFKALPNLTSLSVQFCGITDFTVINEFPVLNNLAAFGQNTGRTDLPTTLGRSALDYDFDQETLFLPFSMMPNRMTNFDGYVPPFTTSNSASNTYLDFNGTQLPANRLQITDLGITVSGVTEDEFKNLASFEYNARLNNPAGTYAQPDGFTFYAISSGTYLHQFTILDDGQPVTIHYQDEAGKELLTSETRSGLVGQTFEITAPEITGYELTELPANASGSFTDQEQTVTFVYKKTSEPIIEGTVTAYYVDTTGTELKKIEQTEAVGTPFTTEQLAFKGYTFKEVTGNQTGLFTKEAQTVTYVYTKDKDTTEPTTSTDSSESSESTETTTSNTDNSETNDSANQVPNTANGNTPSPKVSAKANTAAKKNLPATGEQSSYAWLFLGLLVIGFVNYQYVLKKVKQKK